MRNTATYILIIIFIIIPSTLAGTNLVINGGFELPDVPYKEYEIYTSIPGWITEYGFSLEIQDNVFTPSYEGQQLLELDGFESSNILQDISTASGSFYLFSFAYAGREGGTEGPGNNEIDVYWNDQLLEELRTTTVHEWYLKEYIVQATSAISRIKFNDVGNPNSTGGYLDAVSVVEIPEPTTLLLTGLGFLCCLRRKA